jgi:tetratricopeptide (TPR) repeat protein
MMARSTVALAVLTATFAQPAAAQNFDQLYPICLAAVPVAPLEALEACNTLIDAKRDWPEDRGTLHYDRARVHQWMKKPDLALADMDAAVKLKPNDATILLARAGLLEDMGRTDDALQQVSGALRAGYPPLNGLPRRGFLALKLNRFDAALADFDATLKIDSGNAEGLFGRGVARLKKGDEGGKSDIARSKTIDDTVGPRVGLTTY